MTEAAFFLPLTGFSSATPLPLNSLMSMVILSLIDCPFHEYNFLKQPPDLTESICKLCNA